LCSQRKLYTRRCGPIFERGALGTVLRDLIAVDAARSGSVGRVANPD
jgi:hypothetical protein